jgi:hypothetical protein
MWNYQAAQNESQTYTSRRQASSRISTIETQLKGSHIKEHPKIPLRSIRPIEISLDNVN